MSRSTVNDELPPLTISGPATINFAVVSVVINPSILPCRSATTVGQPNFFGSPNNFLFSAQIFFSIGRSLWTIRRYFVSLGFIFFFQLVGAKFCLKNAILKYNLPQSALERFF